MRLIAVGKSLGFALAPPLLALVGTVAPPTATAQSKLVVRPIAEMKLKQLPSGPLYWRIEIFPTLAAAQTAAGSTGLAAEVADQAWLFTLAPRGGSSTGGSKVAEIGPVPEVTAPEYLLRVNRAGGPPGARTSIHTHPGAEAFYVLAGRMTQRTPQGVLQLDVGQAAPGHAPDTPMQVLSSASVDLDQFVMFVVDATRPFSAPAKFPP